MDSLSKTRVGLPTETPSTNLCFKIKEIPLLSNAFKDSTCVLERGKHGFYVKIRSYDEDPAVAPAPTVREMLAWLEKWGETNGWMHVAQGNWLLKVKRTEESSREYAHICDPDALARACIEAAKG